MSLFSGPEEHAANPPSTWAVVKVGERSWQLRTDGVYGPVVTLGRYERMRDALAASEAGWLRRLYDQEARWYAGEHMPGWRPWADVKAENEAIRARWAKPTEGESA